MCFNPDKPHNWPARFLPSTNFQELRGGSLDHEQHEMSETRETANAAIHQVILRLVGNIASGRAEGIRSFSQKNSRCEFFCEKEKRVPCCRRRIGPFIETNAWFGVYRVTPVTLLFSKHGKLVLLHNWPARFLPSINAPGIDFATTLSVVPRSPNSMEGASYGNRTGENTPARTL